MAGLIDEVFMSVCDSIDKLQSDTPNDTPDDTTDDTTDDTDIINLINNTIEDLNQWEMKNNNFNVEDVEDAKEDAEEEDTEDTEDEKDVIINPMMQNLEYYRNNILHGNNRKVNYYTAEFTKDFIRNIKFQLSLVFSTMDVNTNEVNTNEVNTNVNTNDGTKNVTPKNKFKKTNNKLVYVKVLFSQIIANLHFLHDEKMVNLVYKLKNLITYYIVNCKLLRFVYYYNRIFTDKAHNNIFEQNITLEYKKKMEDAYNNIAQPNILMQNPKFTKGEIIGAKDINGKWWLSEVLQVFKCENQYCYYVEFKGWGERYNEFISDYNRLAYYNSKRHNLFRSSAKDSINNKVINVE